MRQVQHVIGGVYTALIFYGLSWLLRILNIFNITNMTITTTVLILLIIPLFALYPDLDFVLGASMKKKYDKKLKREIYELVSSPKHHRSIATHSHVFILPFFLYIFLFSTEFSMGYIMCGIILGINSHLLLDLIPYDVPDKLYEKTFPQWEIFKYRFKKIFSRDITGVLKSWKFIKVDSKHERRIYYGQIFLGFVMVGLLIFQNIYFNYVSFNGSMFDFIYLMIWG
jgi:hypothetical protein